MDLDFWNLPYVGSDTLHCYELKTFLVGSVHCAIGKEHFSSEQQFKWNIHCRISNTVTHLLLQAKNNFSIIYLVYLPTPVN